MKTIFQVIVLLCVILFLPFLFPFLGLSTPQEPSNAYFPWEVSVVDNQTQVFGILLGQATLQNWVQIWGDDFDLALLTTPEKNNQDAQLEAFYNLLNLGFVESKVILSLACTSEELEQFLKHARKAEILKSGARKISLSQSDAIRALGQKIKTISVVPNVRLTEEDLIQRFGKAAKRIEDENRVRLFYPEKALIITAQAKQKPLLEYTAPEHFNQLYAPL